MRVSDGQTGGILFFFLSGSSNIIFIEVVLCTSSYDHCFVRGGDGWTYRTSSYSFLIILGFFSGSPNFDAPGYFAFQVELFVALIFHIYAQDSCVSAIKTLQQWEPLTLPHNCNDHEKPNSKSESLEKRAVNNIIAFYRAKTCATTQLSPSFPIILVSWGRGCISSRKCVKGGWVLLKEVC